MVGSPPGRSRQVPAHLASQLAILQERLLYLCKWTGAKGYGLFVGGAGFKFFVFAVDFRGPTWTNKIMDTLCRNNGPSVVLMLIDDRAKEEIALSPGDRLLIGRQDGAAKPERRLPSDEGQNGQVRHYWSRSSDVSQRHAEVRVTHDRRIVVKDLGSTNGTLARLSPHSDLELQTNTEVLCGRSLLLQRKTPLWECVEDHSRFENAEAFGAHVQEGLKEYGAEVRIVSATAADSRRSPGIKTQLPLPAHQKYIVVHWRKATFNLALERWLHNRVLIFNSGSLCVPIGSTDGIKWRFTAESEPRQQLLRLARRLSATNCTILLRGATGVGKDVLAHDMHDHSGRANMPFLAVNCANIPASTAESILFGSMRGGFTSAEERPGYFELAHGGTLFLDEIGELSLEMQVKLLRVLEEKRVWRVGDVRARPADVRIIAATNRNLPEMVSQGLFRADLWYRLEGLQLQIPRPDAADIQAMVPSLSRELNPSALDKLQPDELEQLSLLAAQQEWPGNVRELRNALQRYFILREPDRSVEDNWHLSRTMSSGSLTPVSIRGEAGEGTPEPVPENVADLPPGVTTIPAQLGRLITLLITRDTLVPFRWGAWALLGRRLELTGTGAQERLSRLGLSVDPPPDAATLDREIEASRQALQPFLPFIRNALRC